MIILKVKEWLKNPLAQFKIEKEVGSIIHKVIRLNDGHSFELRDVKYSKDFKYGYYISKFHKNLMQVTYKRATPEDTNEGVCNINDIEISGDASMNIKGMPVRRPIKRVSAKK